MSATSSAVMPAAPSDADALKQWAWHWFGPDADEEWIAKALANLPSTALSQTMQSLRDVDQRALEVAASFIQLHAPDSPLYGDLRSIAARIQPAAAGEQAGAVASTQAYMCHETDIPCSCCTTVCEAKAPAVGVADEQIAALKAQFGVTSSGRGIREFTQVKDFALAVAALAAPGAATAAREQEGEVNRLRLALTAAGHSLRAIAENRPEDEWRVGTLDTIRSYAKDRARYALDASRKANCGEVAA